MYKDLIIGLLDRIDNKALLIKIYIFIKAWLEDWMSEEQFYRSKIAEIAGEIKSIDRLRKVYTVAITLLRYEKEKAAEHGGNGTLQGESD